MTRDNDLTEALQGLLEALFRPLDQDGYWDSRRGTIVERLDMTRNASGQPQWSARKEDASRPPRYAPFALMGVARWRLSALANEIFDAQIRQSLEYWHDRVAKPARRAALPSYSLGPIIYAFAKCHLLWPELGFSAVAQELADFALGQFRFRTSEDALLLMGISALERDMSEEQRNSVSSLARQTREAQGSEGLFRWPGEPAAFKHQNQMYTIWGLAHADLALGRDDSQTSISRCLEFTIRERMRSDGALLWHSYRGLGHHIYAAGRSLVDKGYTPEPRCLFSCHQAFFVYAAELFRALSGDAFFDRPVDDALGWLFGRNEVNQSVFDLSGIGLPWRLITIDGRIDTPGQNFIGSYEIGGMILALVGRIEASRLLSHDNGSSS